MSDRRAQRHVRINVLRADEVSVWQSLLELARELDQPASPLRSLRLGRLSFLGPDGRVRDLTPAMIAQILELPPDLVASTVEKLLELQILTSDGGALEIPDAADWFIPASEHPRLNN